VHCRYRETVYHMAVHQAPNAAGEAHSRVDGEGRTGAEVPLVDDRREHSVELWVGAVVQGGGGRRVGVTR
jgi:cyclic beta-1,2-glucan synthetase